MNKKKIRALDKKIDFLFLQILRENRLIQKIIMLSVQSLGLHHAGNYLFQNVNFTIKKNDKIGLVGKNGAGKSTLLKNAFRRN